MTKQSNLSPLMYRHQVIEYRYSKSNDDVYYNWRFAGQKRWNRRITAFKDIPIIELRPKIVSGSYNPYYEALKELDDGKERR